MCPKNYVSFKDVQDCIVKTVRRAPLKGFSYHEICQLVTYDTMQQFDRQFKKALCSGLIFEIKFRLQDGTYCARYHHNAKMYIQRAA